MKKGDNCPSHKNTCTFSLEEKQCPTKEGEAFGNIWWYSLYQGFPFSYIYKDPIWCDESFSQILVSERVGLSTSICMVHKVVGICHSTKYCMPKTNFGGLSHF